MADIDEVLRLCPWHEEGNEFVASYAIFTGRKRRLVDRDQLEPKHLRRG